jgi:hypothetical protein
MAMRLTRQQWCIILILGLRINESIMVTQKVF